MRCPAPQYCAGRFAGQRPPRRINGAAFFIWRAALDFTPEEVAVRTVVLFARLAALPLAHAQPYPNRPVRLVIAAAPGGSTDLLGRVFAQRLSERMGQPFVPENRGGGGGAVAAEDVAKSPPDG